MARTSFIVSKSSFYFYVTMFFFLLLAIFYNSYLVEPVLNTYSIDNTNSHIANIHDHLEYKNRMLQLSNSELSIYTYFDNVTGIALLYSFFQDVFYWISFESVVLIVNFLFVLLLGVEYLKIINILGYDNNVKYLFFLNLFLLYSVQLAGKDVIYSYFLMLNFRFLAQGKILKFYLSILICAVLVRFQIVLLVLFLLIMEYKRISVLYRIIVCYLFSSLFGVLAFKYVIGEGADLGGGISTYVASLNDRYYIGNFLLNPIRFFQYIVELVKAPIMAFHPYIDYVGLTSMFFLLYILARARRLTRLIDLSDNLPSRYLFCMVLLLLVVPIINLRYFLIYTPFIILAINYRIENHNEKNSFVNRL
ncbi:hypothetical protein [Pseudoalteromonas aurantia]|uniref:Wzy n=1 Tax=Pseudoalteromonas aurantia 208 TaxID=1314867 RepID=A0ABR9EE45_9GAMM|nr:hypothetical protein [Pseudoalteromonas aurantia]MBE0369261.1 hypothetical protein [Pseudoalteromonas aurantia 208]